MVSHEAGITNTLERTLAACQHHQRAFMRLLDKRLHGAASQHAFLYASYVQIVNRTYGRVTIMTGAAHYCLPPSNTRFAAASSFSFSLLTFG